MSKQFIFRHSKTITALGAAVFLFNCSTANHTGTAEALRQPTAEATHNDVSPVRKILDRRCVVCHTCTLAPCQLQMDSAWGIQRGATLTDLDKSDVHLPNREKDGPNALSWRTTDKENRFFSVISDSKPANPPMALENLSETELEKSLLYRMVEIGNKNNLASSDKSGITSFSLAPTSGPVRENRTCPRSADQIPDHLGMPYGLPGLSDSELETVKTWVQKGFLSEVKSGPQPSEKATQQIAEWEEILNSSIKNKLMARYFYEHSYSAHFHFEDSPDNEWYELVRSTTPSYEKTVGGNKKLPIKEIATELPYEFPENLSSETAKENSIYFRFKLFTKTVSLGAHIPWELNKKTLNHYKETYLEPQWDKPEKIAEGLVYNNDNNPFKYFAAIPAKLRYQFMLENSFQIVNAMVRGPVCNGQDATHAIRDNFWVFFVNPDSDVTVMDPTIGLVERQPLEYYRGFFSDMKSEMKLYKDSLLNSLKTYDYNNLSKDAESTVNETVSGITNYFNSLAKDSKVNKIKIPKLTDIQKQLNEYKHSLNKNFLKEYPIRTYTQALIQRKPEGYNIEKDLWLGEKENRNALLTILRHGTNASVHYGLVGGRAPTVWLLNYSNFERIYYNLVVDFKPWAPIDIKLATWSAMSSHRSEAEERFISLLPEDSRSKVRATWTQGDVGQANVLLQEYYSQSVGVPSQFQRKYYPNKDIVDDLLTQMTSLYGKEQIIPDSALIAKNSDSADQWARTMIQKGSDGTLPAVKYFPDTVFVKIGDSDNAKVYTIINHRFYMSNDFARDVAKGNYVPSKNILHVFKGLIGSRPNYFITLKESEQDSFFAALNAVTSDNFETWVKFKNTYMIRRNSNQFWLLADWFMDWQQIHTPLEAGIIDLRDYDTAPDGKLAGMNPVNQKNLKRTIQKQLKMNN